jgi:thiol-disulfide isomerase/thioredoxin
VSGTGRDAARTWDRAGPVTADAPRPPRWSPRRKYGVAAVALAVLAAAGVAVASQSNPSSVAGGVDVNHLSVGPAPPSLADAKGWLNTAPLTAADLRGKVVLYDFWTYSCVNCVRTLPHVRAWFDRYRQDGLVVVGIHSPEFDFEKDHGNVTSAVQRLHVDYPVALDDNMDIWNAFGTQYWPEEWVSDRQGHLRYMDVGEGNYQSTEAVLRKLLGVPARAPRAAPPGAGNLGQPPTAAQSVTAETYLGLEKGATGAQPGPATYPNVGTLPEGTARLVGAWDTTAQQVQAVAPGAAVVLGYRARAVNLVMATASAQPVRVDVQLDGKPLPPAERSPAVQVDAQGRTFLRVSTPDLYPVVLGGRVEGHTLRLTAAGSGVQAFAFTFGA